MNARTLFAGIAVLVAALISGCATPPLATPEADTLAKQLRPVADQAIIYVIRSETASAPFAVNVTLDGKDMGATGADTYFRWTVPAGEHIIVSHTENAAGLMINAEPGHIYYVWQSMYVGLFKPRSELVRMDRTSAEMSLRHCYLLENKS